MNTAYRFVICDDVDDDSVKAADVKVPTFMPPFEMTRISRIKAGQRMDLKLFQDALKAMEGEHSFRSFECFTKALYSGHEYERDPMKKHSEDHLFHGQHADRIRFRSLLQQGRRHF